MKSSNWINRMLLKMFLNKVHVLHSDPLELHQLAEIKWTYFLYQKCGRCSNNSKNPLHSPLIARVILRYKTVNQSFTKLFIYRNLINYMCVLNIINVRIMQGYIKNVCAANFKFKQITLNFIYLQSATFYIRVFYIHHLANIFLCGRGESWPNLVGRKFNYIYIYFIQFLFHWFFIF